MIPAVIVHFESPENTRQLLATLQNYYSISSIVVVAHSQYPHAVGNSGITILEQENLGYAAGVNRALRYLEEEGAKSALVLNPDIAITESQVAILIRESEQADCIFPSIREGDQTLHGYTISKYGTIRPAESGQAEFYPGTCFVISIEAWKKTGGLSEDYFHYFEDFDFCVRLRKAGCKIHHDPSVVIEHIGKSGADYPATDLPRYAVRNHLIFLRALGRMSTLTFLNVTLRQLLYLFRWPKPWRGFPAWHYGIRDFGNHSK